MKKFSWHTIPIIMTKLETVYQYAVDRFIPYRTDKSGFGSYIHIKRGTFVVDEDGGWKRYKPNRKGGHSHRRNYCICNYCGHFFRKNKGIHAEGFDFCGGTCSEMAQAEADAEADVGGCFEPHYYDET